MNKRVKDLLEKELLTLEELEEVECMPEVRMVNRVSGMCNKYSNSVWYECITECGEDYDFYVKSEEE